MSGSTSGTGSASGPDAARHGFTNAVVRSFLHSHMSLVLLLLAAAVGAVALFITPREEDPQIVVPLADVYVDYPGHGAAEVEKLVSTPLEKLLYEIDGVEYVYSMSRDDQAIITVRFYVGEDRERSLVKLFKRIDEHVDAVPAGVTGWVIKPVEIDDVPVVTLTLKSATAGSYALRRVAEELTSRLAEIPDLSRAYVVGGLPRTVHVYLDADRLRAYGLAPLDVRDALRVTNVAGIAGDINQRDQAFRIDVGPSIASPHEMADLVVGVHGDAPVFLKDVARIEDGPAEVTEYVRHGWGPAAGFAPREGFPSTTIGPRRTDVDMPVPAVTIAVAKKRGTNAVSVADAVLAATDRLRASVVPADVDVVVTRNYGQTADDKVNELVEALAVAVFIVIALLTLGMGWREALIVALAVPVVFGLTLAVNLLCGFTINRVTLFALILSLGLLVDDPIVDVENISRHFHLAGRASKDIVMEAVAEIRPPLITATLAVIVSFLPMSFITGMMGPYMRPMALNVPVAMAMSMVVAFTITPWLSYQFLKKSHTGTGPEGGPDGAHGDLYDVDELRRSGLYRFFYPLMAPLMRSRGRAWTFMLVMGVLTVAAGALAATRHVPLKMLPFDNKNELLLTIDMPEGTTLERTDAVVRDVEGFLAGVPEVSDLTSYTGVASPMDFNGLVRHYYLRQSSNVADIRVNLVGKKNRRHQSHAIGLRIRDDLNRLVASRGGLVRIVETPPGPPVLSGVVAEVYGEPGQSYDDLVAAAKVVRRRLEMEPGVVEPDDTVEADRTRFVFETDREKSALHRVSVANIVNTLALCVDGAVAGQVHEPRERNPLDILLRMPRDARSGPRRLGRIHVRGEAGQFVPLQEIGRWREDIVDGTIYHKNLRRVVYVTTETAGRPPAEVVVDVLADKVDVRPQGIPQDNPAGWVGDGQALPVEGRTFVASGGGIPWGVAAGIDVDFAGEGEWKITLDVFRDLGLAFGAALVAIYILLVAQTGSFAIPVVVMLAIPLSILGIMPGFALLNVVSAGHVGGYADPVFFTATGMIGMIALAGIVTRDAIILVDFIHLSQARGRSLFDAIMESRVVRLRPILLTTGTAMLSAAPIVIDPIFSGLAWALIFGLFASTVFTLFVIPVAYWLVYDTRGSVRS